MPVTSTLPTSRRKYLSQSELEQYADITVSDSTEADDQISQAEEIIDAYVGPQEKFYPHELTGRATAGGSTSITLQTNHQNIYEIDYFKWCEVEIIGGTGEGQRKGITGSTKAGVLTTESFSTAPDSTSFYRIHQLGKFPRYEDVTFYSEQTPNTYYKSIPEAVKRAVAAQVEYMIAMGADYFKSNSSELQSERIGDYSYERGTSSTTGVKTLIAPKAQALLRGIKNKTGRIVI